MKLTPLEIKQQTFERSLRGYDVAEVKAYLSLISSEWEHMQNRNRDLEDKIDALEERVKHYERVEEALHETLQTAKESAEQKLEGARAEARNSIEKAELQADAIIREAHQRRREIRQSILRLIDKKEEMSRSLQSYIDMMQDSVKQLIKDDKEVFNLPNEEELDQMPAPARLIELDTEDETGQEVDLELSENMDLDLEDAIEDEEEERRKKNGKMDLDSDPEDAGLDRLDDILDEID
jgi:cell division initiation protein